MTAATQENAPFVTRDFTPYIGDHSVDVFVGQIRQVHATTDTRPGYDQRTGTFTVQVGEMLARHALQPGSMVTVAFRQDLHPAFLKRGGENPWNGIDLSEGHAVLLAVRSADGGHSFHPVAALSADPAHAANVEAVRQAYRIESGGGDEKLVSLGRALESPNPALLQYALHTLADRNALGREQAVHLMSLALISTATPPENRTTISALMAELFQATDLNDTTRTHILAALARAMVQEKDKEQQAMLAALLRSCLMSRAVGSDPHRYALVKDITAPPADQVIQALTGLENDKGVVPDEDDRAQLGRMAHIWQIAKR